jgi:hypothetical protein
VLDVLGTFQGLTKINNRSGPTSAGTPAGPGIPLCESEIPMPKPTTLASGQLNSSNRPDVKLHRPADLPAFILVKWPSAPSASWPMPASR